ncbi:MAG TPA: T9SS type A sorting domain-containing protein [Flavobacteriales bacterium]|nr:T9SS type A sorting domain-containing protein [Flavobacteriales bacterium]
MFQSAGTNGTVNALAIQPDAKIIVGGAFSQTNGGVTGNLVRLLPGGLLDTSFSTGSGFDADVDALWLQPDGKLLAGGNFTTFNGEPCSELIRINEDGSRDTSFMAPISAAYQIGCITSSSAGDIWVGGRHISYSSQPPVNMIRLDQTGLLDTNWIPVPWISGQSGTVYDAEILDDGRILVAGQFTELQGQSRRHLVRLYQDGLLDTTFESDYSPGHYGGTSHDIEVLPNGRVVGVGSMVYYHEMPVHNIYRCMPDGEFDISFNRSGGAANGVTGCATLSDGSLMIVGPFRKYNGYLRRGVAHLTADGDLDASFDPGGGMQAAPNDDYWLKTNCVAVLPEDKVLVGGNFSTFGDQPYNGLARLNADGSVDTTLVHTSLSGPSDAEIRSVAMLPDGKYLIGGDFDTYNGSSGADFARLYPSGVKDESFQAGSGITSYTTGPGTHAWVNAICVQDDGKILVAGLFSKYNGVIRERVARILPNGALDGSFVPAEFNAYEIQAMALQPDGKILVGGEFTTWNGPAVPRLVRLMPDGSLDLTFTFPASSRDVHAVLVDPLGRIYVGEDTWGSCMRLNPDGSVDPTWMSDEPSLGSIEQFSIQGDKLIAVGGFEEYQGVPRHSIARLNNDFTTAVSTSAALHKAEVFPNPTTGICTLSPAISGPFTLTVTDLAGRVVFEQRFAAGNVMQHTIDLSNKPSGLYMLQLRTQEGTLTGKVVKE